MDLSYIEHTTATVIMENFNAAFPTWGSNHTNKAGAGETVEDFLDSNPIKLMYTDKDPGTFMHYSGSTTDPDLTIVSTDLSDSVSQKILEDPGSGHRMSLLSVTLNQQTIQPNNQQTQWDFKKADWVAFNAEVETTIT